ncbi:hypothetical protein D3C85_1750290 [compost metagenome]
MASSRSNSGARLAFCGKSSASEVPGRGKDSSPGEAMSPQRLSTARKEPWPDSAMVFSNSRMATSAAASGITHWYCWKPERP